MFLLHSIKQWVELRRARNCLAKHHTWEEVRDPTRPHVVLTRCKHCHFVGFHRWEPRLEAEQKMTHHPLLNFSIAPLVIAMPYWINFVEDISHWCGVFAQIFALVLVVLQIAKLLRAKA